jgi:hypothetical protein
MAAAHEASQDDWERQTALQSCQQAAPIMQTVSPEQREPMWLRQAGPALRRHAILTARSTPQPSVRSGCQSNHLTSTIN